MDSILVDLSVTAHTSARTGIQRVALSLSEALTHRTAMTPVTFDPQINDWRGLETWERRQLHSGSKTWTRSVHWPWHRRLIHTLKIPRRPRPELFADHSGLISPEVFDATTLSALPGLLSRVRGPRIALFHDAIALQQPALSPTSTTGRFPAYLHTLSHFDGIAAISAHSRDALLDYWRWAGWSSLPPVLAVPLGMDLPVIPPLPLFARPHPRPTILSVGTLEGRKNHVALLAACEQLWREGLVFNLRLIGMAQRQTGRTALSEITRLKAAGHPLRYDGPATDAVLEEAYSESLFTVYPSVIEGFGLPVLESLARGKPCICRDYGALGESARGGGCLALPEVSASALAGAIRELLTRPETLHRLQAEARARTFRTWDDYAGDLLSWMDTLPRRSA